MTEETALQILEYLKDIRCLEGFLLFFCALTLFCMLGFIYVSWYVWGKRK